MWNEVVVVGRFVFAGKFMIFQKKLDVVGRRGMEAWECSGNLIFTGFLSKKIGFAPWPHIMLSQALIYYWQQEIFLFTLVSDSEAIL